MLIDDNIFLSLVKELSYFYKRGLIKKHELHTIQGELLEIVDRFEYIAKNGNGGNQAEVSIYISAIDLEPNYSHTEYNDNTYVQFWSPSAEVVTSYNPEICEWQKKWIESLKRYATLITKCNEKEGIRFFDNQRDYINSLSATELS